MKILITLFFVSLPVAAQACGLTGGSQAGCGQGGCGHAATAIYAVLAALGYWVMQHAAKETANCVKRTGSVVGTTLVIIGLLGLLCGVGSHVKNAIARSSCSYGQGAGMGGVQGMIMRDGQEMMARGGQAAGAGGGVSMREYRSASLDPVSKKSK